MFAVMFTPMFYLDTIFLFIVYNNKGKQV